MIIGTTLLKLEGLASRHIAGTTSKMKNNRTWERHTVCREHIAVIIIQTTAVKFNKFGRLVEVSWVVLVWEFAQRRPCCT